MPTPHIPTPWFTGEWVEHCGFMGPAAVLLSITLTKLNVIGGVPVDGNGNRILDTMPVLASVPTFS